MQLVSVLCFLLAFPKDNINWHCNIIFRKTHVKSGYKKLISQLPYIEDTTHYHKMI